MKCKKKLRTEDGEKQGLKSEEKRERSNRL